MTKLKKYRLTINYHNGKKVTEEFDSKDARDEKVEIIEEGLGYRQFGSYSRAINQRLNKSFVTKID